MRAHANFTDERYFCRKQYRVSNIVFSSIGLCSAIRNKQIEAGRNGTGA